MDVYKWMEKDEVERCRSSDAIARTAFFGRIPGDVDGWTAPKNPSELRRCILLLREVPEVYEEGMKRLVSWFPEWAAIHKIWDKLEASLIDELGNDLPNEDAPKTQSLLQLTLKGVGVHAIRYTN